MEGKMRQLIGELVPELIAAIETVAPEGEWSLTGCDWGRELKHESDNIDFLIEWVGDVSTVYNHYEVSASAGDVTASVLSELCEVVNSLRVVEGMISAASKIMGELNGNL